MGMWTTTTVIVEEKTKDSGPRRIFLEHLLELLGGGDSRELDYYLDKLFLIRDDNIDDMLREIFVLLKLQHADGCPDFVTLDREKLEAEKIERELRLSQRALLQENRNKCQKQVFDQAWNWIENCINAYEFIHNNQGKYKIDKLPFPLWARESACELVKCKYVRRSFWGWLSTKSTQFDDEIPFVKLDWISHISENLLAEYKDAAEQVLFADEFYGLRGIYSDKLSGGLERNINRSLHNAIEKKLKMMDI